METQWSRKDIPYNLLSTFLSQFYSSPSVFLDGVDSANLWDCLRSMQFSQNGSREGQIKAFVLSPFPCPEAWLLVRQRNTTQPLPLASLFLSS